ncbi:MAG TPA: hypothetical protein VMQ61_02240 [Thermoanaerobaculia bacterium]|nr:hypothetical protein [Thermoanaerobaculia bacterium]
MDWVVCPRCHFSQQPADRCRRCGEALRAPDNSAAPAPAPGAAPAPASSGKTLSRRAGALVAAAAVILLLLVLRMLRPAESPRAVPGAATPAPAAAVLDLSGRWHGSLSKTVAGNPPRPVLTEIVLETDAGGRFTSGRVTFTDPGRGGAAAGYRMVPDGPRRLAEASAALAAGPRGAPLALDFLQLPGWVPARDRLWKAFEGASPGGAPASYLLVESLETDYLLQAGINASGFLSWVCFSPDEAPPRGRDEISRVIHPEPGASLSGFQNLIWDLSGAANFVTMQLPVTISGPEGGPADPITLTR